jgi:hypothetical protein
LLAKIENREPGEELKDDSDKDLECESEEDRKEATEAEIKNRTREMCIYTNEETFLWTYETIFN